MALKEGLDKTGTECGSESSCMTQASSPSKNLKVNLPQIERVAIAL